MYKIYIVEEGDTLEKIADKHNTTVEFLKKLNGDISILEKGIEIIVPKNKNLPFEIYTVKKGDNIYEISKKFGVNYKDILLINALNEGEYIYPNQDIFIPKEGVGIYLVNEVETLNNVASKLNLSTKELIETNASVYLLPNQIILYKKEKSI